MPSAFWPRGRCSVSDKRRSPFRAAIFRHGRVAPGHLRRPHRSTRTILSQHPASHRNAYRGAIARNNVTWRMKASSFCPGPVAVAVSSVISWTISSARAERQGKDSYPQACDFEGFESRVRCGFPKECIRQSRGSSEEQMKETWHRFICITHRGLRGYRFDGPAMASRHPTRSVALSWRPNSWPQKGGDGPPQTSNHEVEVTTLRTTAGRRVGRLADRRGSDSAGVRTPVQVIRAEVPQCECSVIE